VLKRGFDILLSGVGLIVSLPLWGIIALAVKLHDGGPVFYRQERVGKDRRVFTGLKFRSMVADSDRKWGVVPAAANDPRITKVGRILRATAMDELPQLWSIFRGDMSFVGPRPEWVELVKKFRAEIPCFDLRHKVRPGLTGWPRSTATAKYRGGTSFATTCFTFASRVSCSIFDLSWSLFSSPSPANGRPELPKCCGCAGCRDGDECGARR